MPTDTFPFTLVAIRQPGETGWRMTYEREDDPYAHLAVLKRVPPNSEAVALTRITAVPEDNWPTDYAIRGTGWLYDPKISRWHSPHDAVAISAPVEHRPVAFHIERVICGHIDLVFKIGEAEVFLQADDVYHELDQLVVCARAVRERKPYRFSLHGRNGLPLYVHTIPTGASVTIAVTDDQLIPHATALVDAVRLLDQIAALCRELADHPALGVHWSAWPCDGPDSDAALGRADDLLEELYPFKEGAPDEYWDEREKAEVRLICELMPLCDWHEERIAQVRDGLRSLQPMPWYAERTRIQRSG